MQKVADFAHRSNKPLYTTEGWATTMYGAPQIYNDEAAWDWIKDACEEGVRLAIAKGWTGICTSGFSEPHFRVMWQDVSWHKKLTALIRND
jgi:hypothetical protein